METLYKHIQVKQLIISGEYSLSGSTAIINFDNDSEDIINIRSLSNIRELSNLNKIKTVKEYFLKFFKTLNIDEVNFKYCNILGVKKSKEYLSYLNSMINSTLPMLTTYHANIFPIRKNNYLYFKNVKLEGLTLEKPIYDHSGVTGRTSIKKGFNFLTLKKERRKLLKPSNNKNYLIEMDFKSCEPFFYLKSQGFKIETNDVYTWLANKYQIDFKNRDRIKRGILSMIYGANEYTISRIMKIQENKILDMKRDLKITDLKMNLEKQFNSQGFICNYYGRPITSDNNLVNYWIQSSAVDYCSLTFKNFCKSNNIVPSFFIHDSMTFEIEKERAEQIIKIKSVKDPVSNIEIPVEYTILT